LTNRCKYNLNEIVVFHVDNHQTKIAFIISYLAFNLSFF
jgi:hypothetical protein